MVTVVIAGACGLAALAAQRPPPRPFPTASSRAARPRHPRPATLQVLRRRRCRRPAARPRTQAASTPSPCPAKYGGDGYTGLPREGAPTPRPCPAPTPTATSRSTSTSSLPTAPAAAGRLSADRVHARLLRGQQDELGGDELRRRAASTGTTTTPGSPRAATSSSTTRRAASSTASNGQGSTGETQLDSRRYEINDFQHLAGQVAGALDVHRVPFNVNPQRVVATGGSYGGGFSWLALTDPKWTCTADTGPGGTDMNLAAAAPKYGWTDLVYSLVPTGLSSSEPGSCRRPTAATPARCSSTASPCPAPSPDRHPEAVDHRRALRQRQDRHPARHRAHDLPAVDRPDAIACLEPRPVRDRTRSARRTISDTAAGVHQRPLGLLPERLLHQHRHATRATGSRSSTPARSPTRCSRRSRTGGCQPARSVVPGLPDPAVLRRLPALRPEQGEGVGRHLRRRPPRLRRSPTTRRRLSNADARRPRSAPGRRRG